MNLNTITVVDARMGRGKTSAAIRYMNEHKDEKRFLYITPFLTEVDRICEQCDFEQAEGTDMTKSAELKLRMRRGENVAATHVLFSLLDEEALGIARENHYSLIVDESVELIERVPVTSYDLDVIKKEMTEIDEFSRVLWKDKTYSGRFSDYKDLSDAGALFLLDTAFMKVLNPDLFLVFEDVILLTYLFDGQYQKAYFEYFGLPFRVVGIREDDNGYYFSDEPDNPPPIDYRSLIDIIDNSKMNKEGAHKNALSWNWFRTHSYNSPAVKALRSHLHSFFRQRTGGQKNSRIWTTYKESKEKLVSKSQRRYEKNFLQMYARATNDYRDCVDVAYIANRFLDPNIIKFFAQRGVSIPKENEDLFALSNMLQWIWRSAIRDGRPIRLYIPSRRMRELFIRWMDEVSKGGRVFGG